MMEACGSSHHWGRMAERFGHTVRLLPAQHVAKSRIGNKTDRRGTEAILAARHREDIVPLLMAEAGQLEERIGDIEKQLRALSKTVSLVERLEEIPGIGLLNATA